MFIIYQNIWVAAEEETAETLELAAADNKETLLGARGSRQGDRGALGAHGSKQRGCHLG